MIISNMMRMKVSQLCVFTTLSFLAAMLLIPSVLAYRCSNAGFCGTRGDYCDPPNCQSQSPSPPPPFTPPSLPPPPPPVPSPDITEIITSELFDLMLLHRNDAICLARGFYTYDAFVQAARSFTGFATTGDNIDDRKREVAAFFAHTSHMTTEGWPDAPDGTYAWGYCINTDQASVPPEKRPFDCIQSAEWPCAPGKKYYGRGPMLITYNFNYGPCGVAIGEDLLGNPDLVETDTVISFKSALWYWMTPVPQTKPSPHDVMVGNWVPSQNDIDANRLPGFGVTTNIFNGGLECGKGPDERATNRIGFYERFCGILGVSPGKNTGCEDQKPFGPTALLFNSM